jgi:hypothetical protein
LKKHAIFFSQQLSLGILVLGILFAPMAIDISLEESQDDEPEIVDPERCNGGEKHGTRQSPSGDARDAVLLGAANYLTSQVPQVPAPPADPTFQKTKDDAELFAIDRVDRSIAV